MVKKTKKLAHCGMAENRLSHFRFYGQRLYRLSIIVGAILESPLPFLLSFNLRGTAQTMILVIFLFRLIGFRKSNGTPASLPSPPHPTLSPLLGGEEKGEGGDLSADQRSII